jgi:hypothetical protein
MCASVAETPESPPAFGSAETGRLGQVQSFRGFSKMQFLCDGDEISQVPQLDFSIHISNILV